MVTLQKIENKNRYFFAFFDCEERLIELPTLFSLNFSRKRIYSMKTVHEYAKDLAYFLNFLEKECDESACKLTLDEKIRVVEIKSVEDYLLHISHLASSTVRKRDLVLKTFFEWLTTIEGGRVFQVENHPYSNGKLKTAFVHRRVPRFLTCERIIEFIKLGFFSESQRSIVHFMYDVGVRVSEVEKLLLNDLPKLDDYDTDQQHFLIRIQGSKGRGGQPKERYAIISRAVIQRIQLLHNNYQLYRGKKYVYGNKMPLFLSSKGQAITTESIRTAFYTASQRLIKQGKINSPIGPHCMRHSNAYSILAENNGKTAMEKMIIVKENLGHSTIRSTEIYAAIPHTLMTRKTSASQLLRCEEAQKILDNTLMLQKNHKEKRGYVTL